jgi:hypothetical protein
MGNTEPTEMNYKYLNGDNHIALYRRYNYLSDQKQYGTAEIENPLFDEIRNGIYPIEVINEVINYWGDYIPSVHDFYYIIQNYTNYKNINFEQVTLNCLRNQWPEHYSYILSYVNN